MAKPAKNAGSKQPQKVRMLGDKKVQNALFVGKGRKFFAAMVDGSLVLKDGEPVPYRSVGELRYV